VTQQPSRKQFFAKLLGASAALAVSPKLFAKSTSGALSAAASQPSAPAPRLQVRVEGRAVARRAETI
jgi:hypothetical protein